MGRRVLPLLCVLACLAAGTPGTAQEGHPLTGTWGGDWGPSATERNHLTFVMNWDGDKVTGVINPGPDAVQLASVFLDVANWTVRIEGDAKDASGKPVRVIAEGKLEDISSPHRSIAGTWRQGTTSGDFRITRD